MPRRFVCRAELILELGDLRAELVGRLRRSADLRRAESGFEDNRPTRLAFERRELLTCLE